MVGDVFACRLNPIIFCSAEDGANSAHSREWDCLVSLGSLRMLGGFFDAFRDLVLWLGIF